MLKKKSFDIKKVIPVVQTREREEMKDSRPVAEKWKKEEYIIYA